jgi:hypothetical protein
MNDSELDPEGFGYPFVDRNSGVVVVTPATARTRAQVAGLASRMRARNAPELEVRSQTPRHSRADLDRLMDAVIGKQPEGLTVVASYPDPENDRIVAEVTKLDDRFLSRVSRLAGPSALAVRVVEDVASKPAARETDTSPFYGGSNIDGCTSGFPWHYGAVEMMLTAGHCYPNGGSVSTPSSSMGAVTTAMEENWNTDTGTVYMTGETVYRGDLALVRITSPKTSAPYIYTGGQNSSSSRSVAGKWSRSPASGDKYCTGGRMSGEQCNWTVKWSAPGNYTYIGGVARHVWKGEKRDRCIIGGDSGGPVYTVDSSGGIVAKGIISGATGYGGGDNFAGALEGACVNIFTDIWDAYRSMPGDIN